jgi:hypothetical protein
MVREPVHTTACFDHGEAGWHNGARFVAEPMRDERDAMPGRDGVPGQLQNEPLRPRQFLDLWIQEREMQRAPLSPQSSSLSPAFMRAGRRPRLRRAA